MDGLPGYYSPHYKIYNIIKNYMSKSDFGILFHNLWTI